MMMVLAILRELGPYAWFIVGALFLIAETLLPGASLIWFGVAASLTGGLLILWPLGWEGQMVAFLAFSAATVVGGRVIAARTGGVGEAAVNRGARALVGRELGLCEPIVNGFGRAAWGDGVWRVTGPDLPAGSRVRVVGVEAATLRVEPAEPADKDVRNPPTARAAPSGERPPQAG
jgi:membrane protein implicated in regulation of membrane protease activity